MTFRKRRSKSSVEAENERLRKALLDIARVPHGNDSQACARLRGSIARHALGKRND